MNDILKLFGGSIDSIIDSIGNAADKIFTSEEERMLLQKELESIRLNAKLKATDQSVELEKEITSRWKIDSENIVTRLVRPMTMFWSYALFTIVLLFDGNVGDFHINQSYIPILETILVTITISYVGARSWDKYTKPKINSVDLF